MTLLAQLTLGTLLMVWSIFSGAKDYPAAVLGTEDGFVDLTLSISKYEKQKNGIARFLIKNTLDGKRIGFVIELHPTWKAQKIENVDALYGLPTTNLTFLTRVNAQVVGLANDPANIENQPIKMKFFLNSDGPDELYSEVFVNVDLKRRVLEFNEKDPEFRGALVKSLSK
jgi:hypothetical protein